MSTSQLVVRRRAGQTGEHATEGPNQLGHMVNDQVLAPRRALVQSAQYLLVDDAFRLHPHRQVGQCFIPRGVLEEPPEIGQSGGKCARPLRAARRRRPRSRSIPVPPHGFVSTGLRAASGHYDNRHVPSRTNPLLERLWLCKFRAGTGGPRPSQRWTG